GYDVAQLSCCGPLYENGTDPKSSDGDRGILPALCTLVRHHHNSHRYWYYDADHFRSSNLFFSRMVFLCGALHILVKTPVHSEYDHWQHLRCLHTADRLVRHRTGKPHRTGNTVLPAVHLANTAHTCDCY